MTEQNARFERACELVTRLDAALGSVVVGQPSVVSDLLMAFCAGGHVLLEGLPGLGKTTLVKTLAACLDLPLSRVQCTPDLLPADVIGSELPAGESGLQFRPGPLFAPLVLVDEINRATPRTQAAFLEAMQERQVTSLGRRHALPEPHWILATQNPIELEGTYPLPEAQLDRFMVKVAVPFPDRHALMTIADLALDPHPKAVTPRLDPHELRELLTEVGNVVVAEPMRRRAVNLLLAMQPEGADAHPLVRRHVRYGPSPRSVQALLRCAQVRALMNGRPYVAVADLVRAATPVLRHRLLLRFDSTLDGMSAEQVIERLSGEHLTA